MKSEIVSIGHELLMGEIVDTNTSWLAQRLSELGIPVRWTSIVGDDMDDLTDVFKRALGRSDVLITTGGIGPTSDDMTREAVARVVGEEMLVDPESLAWLKGVFEKRGIAMPETNVKQAMMIPSATTVPNPGGTAPGWWVEREGTRVVLLPGPPRELQRMWRATVGPKLMDLAVAGVVVTKTLKTAGITEGGIDEMLSHLFGLDNPYLGIYAHPDGIHLRMISRGGDEAQALAALNPMEQEIRSTLRDAIWGVDDQTPAHSAVDLLTSNNLTLGVVEGVSGGAIASQFIRTPGSGAAFRGSLIASDRGQARSGDRTVSTVWTTEPERTALQLAQLAIDAFDSSVGVGVTSQATDGPQANYGVAVISPNGSRTAEGRGANTPDATMQRAATLALVELVAALSSDHAAL